MLDPSRLEVPDGPYPWGFRLIGSDLERLREVALEVLGDRDPRLRPGNSSRTGKFCSLEAEVVVRDREDQLALFARLAEQRGVLRVL
jgi:putative lipoic acid-binding regulatory protein